MEGTILIPRQVDDFLVGTTNEEAAKRLTKRTGEEVKFEHEKDLPIAFLGLVNDCDGVEIKQHNDSTLMSSRAYVERLLTIHGWDAESPNAKSPGQWSPHAMPHLLPHISHN